MIRIRSATTRDYAQVMELLRQLNPDDPPATSRSQALYEQLLANPLLTLLVAEDGDKLVGSCYLNIIPNLTRGSRSYALIENVVTDAARRRTGIGRALMQAAVEKAWAADCYKVMLMSGRTDSSVRAFYRSCDFRDDEKQAYVIRAGK